LNLWYLGERIKENNKKQKYYYNDVNDLKYYIKYNIFSTNYNSLTDIFYSRSFFNL
jgi:hypothetical protein